MSAASDTGLPHSPVEACSGVELDFIEALLFGYVDELAARGFEVEEQSGVRTVTRTVGVEKPETVKGFE